MRFVNASLTLLSTALSLKLAISTNASGTDLEKEFELWAENFERQYQSGEEKEKRMKVWMDNHEFIEEHNAKEPKPSYTLGHNQFSDMTEDEIHEYNRLGRYAYEHEEMDTEVDEKFFAQIKTRVTDIVTTKGRRLNEDVEGFLPASVNWVDRGVVTSVKDQKQCGSCWDFSTVAVLESSHAIETGELVSFSEQEILDCDYSNSGCNGGWPNRAFAFIENDLSGLCTNESYPYVAKQHVSECPDMVELCDRVSFTKVLIHGMLPQSKNALKMGLNLMPLSVAINAATRAFHFYKGGVFDAPCDGSKLDHAVTAVGYSTEGEGYWLVKNSWGTSWGDNGYIKMAMDTLNPSNEGQCGIYKAVSTALTV